MKYEGIPCHSGFCSHLEGKQLSLWRLIIVILILRTITIMAILRQILIFLRQVSFWTLHWSFLNNHELASVGSIMYTTHGMQSIGAEV